MDIRREIETQVDQLSTAMQERVLRFVCSLRGEPPLGENGAALSHFSGILDPVSARQISEAIEKECGQVDSAQG